MVTFLFIRAISGMSRWTIGVDQRFSWTQRLHYFGHGFGARNYVYHK